MTTTQTDPNEITQLRQELDALRKEFQELRRFLRVDPPEEEGKPATLNITCTTLSLCDPQGQLRGRLIAAKDAAFLSFDGGDAQQRIFFGVENDEPLLEFQTAAHETTLHAYAGAQSGRGEIVVFEKGRPRAVMKAFDGERGSVAVTHDDGTPCAGMISQKTGGQIMLLTPEHKVAIKLVSDIEIAPEGGMILVSRKDGQPVVSMNAAASGGAVMILDEGDFSAAMMNGEQGGGIFLNATDKKSSINLQSAANGHSGVSILDSENRSVAQLCGEDHGGALTIHDKQSRERAVIRMAAEGPFLQFQAADEKIHPVLLTGFHDRGALYLENARGDIGGLNMGEFGGSLTFLNEQKTIQLSLGFDEKGCGLHLKPQGNLNSAAALVTQEQGGLLMVSAPDGYRRGVLSASNDGGQLGLFSDLGIERVLLGSVKDGGALTLKWGGTPGIVAVATDKGGCVIANNADGETAATLPPREDDPEDL
ncbi:MAG TPA: hypothetical protein VIK53_18080 [Verrucomicrobiae bacterium]